MTTSKLNPTPAVAARHAPTRDADLLNAGEALRRAAGRAQALAQSTGTPCYVWQDGRMVNIGAPVAGGVTARSTTSHLTPGAAPGTVQAGGPGSI